MEDIRDILSRFEINKINNYRRELLGLAIIIAATFLFYQQIYSKNAAEIKKLDSMEKEMIAEVNRISEEVKETQKSAERLKDAMERLGELESKFMTTKSRLPSDKQLSFILKDVVDEDAKKDIKFTTVKPLPIEDKGEYFRLPFQMAMQTKFYSFGKYLEKIEDMPRIINVENFRIDAKEENQPLLSIQLFMSTYVLGGK